MAILGVHDAHDAGAAMVGRGAVVGAVNEERFTKLKNDVGFPKNSVEYMLGLGEDIDGIAIPWIGGSALFGRISPGIERARWNMWRKQTPKPQRLSMHLRNMAFKVIQNQDPKWIWRPLGTAIGGSILSKKLRGIGIDKKLVFVEHHVAHAASAYYASGFKEALVITLDGAGDGLCGSVSIGDNGELKRINSFKASNSIGIFYGAATLACDMRYSEDEGKLMSLAAYSYPEKIPELSDIVRYDSDTKQLRAGTGINYELLLGEYLRDRFLWRYSREAFACAVQRHVEEQVLALVKQHIKETGIHKVALAGGFFSNIIVNMLINELPEVHDMFVFPHMGDGGIALGAAYYSDWVQNGKFNTKQLDSIYFGSEYDDSQIERVLKKYRGEKKISYEEKSDIAAYTGDWLAEKDGVALWFQGKMEYGPRALGNRSVLTVPNSQKNRDRINLIIKRRPYYQPFASSILEEDAAKLLSPYKRPNHFMTVGYRVRESRMQDLVAASHVDGTTRPQTLVGENKLYRKLLERVRKRTGVGALLNTSLNRHGKPIVMTPEDALWTLMNTGARHLSIGNFFVEKR